MRRRWLLVLLVLSMALGGAHAQFGRNYTDEFLTNPEGRTLMQIYGVLKSDYLNEIEDATLIQGAIRGMLEALDDPYTGYLAPEDAALERQTNSGVFGGIGALLSAHDRLEGVGVEIVNVFRGSPAWNAGIQRGDVFVKVDGVNVENATTDEVVELVRGLKGTAVELDMRRAGHSELLHFSIVRDTINIVSVESTVLPNNVGYISISTFANRQVYEQVTEQLAELKAQGITALILDLRDNPGGYLDQGILVADEFLTEGDIVFQRTRGVTKRVAAATPEAFKLPMVVLVNGNSASASEIVAGALQDHGRALVVGETTYGKGVGQSVMSLRNGGQLTYLSFEWLTPDRQGINRQGITPDVYAEDTRYPTVTAVEGQGLEPGQEVEIVVDGRVLGTGTVDDEGHFRFIELPPRPELSEVQGRALVDLEHDHALQVAYETVRGVVTATR